MTSVLDPNVHCLSIEGTFDDCQDLVKALFADPEIRKTQHLAAVNSINWARILAQITYYFAAYFSLLDQTGLSAQDTPEINFVVPTGNFGDILAGFFAKRMGLPISKLLIATNENDILYRFFQSGKYEKHESSPHSSTMNGGIAADGAKAHVEGVKETLSPAMDILVSSNFERLIWMLCYESAAGASITASSSSSSSASDVNQARQRASQQVAQWFNSLKLSGAFAVPTTLLEDAKKDFGAERISNEQTVETIKSVYGAPTSKNYILDPHSAVGINASHRIISAGSDPNSFTISLATAHPAKFANAVDLALKGQEGYSWAAVFPKEFDGLETAQKKVRLVGKDVLSGGLEGIRRVILEEISKEGVQV
jgi:threonine synthase